MPAESFPEELPGSKLHMSALCIIEPAAVSVTVTEGVEVTVVGWLLAAVVTVDG